MRKSAAPSSLLKGGGFIPPRSVSENNVALPQKSASPTAKRVVLAGASLPAAKRMKSPTKDLDDASKMGKDSSTDRSNSESSARSTPSASSFRAPRGTNPSLPASSRSVPSLPTSRSLAKPDEKKKAEEPSGDAAYWRVMWCKYSKKKHKTYDDGFLSIKSTGVLILQDTEGKEIGKSTSHNRTSMATLGSGDTLEFSGKEMELTSQISASEYLSGAIFIKQTTQAPTPILPVKKVTKAFTPHLSVTGELTAQTPKFVLHSPDAPNAFVLWRDGDSAVVVDPAVARFLRVHQREGVEFMFRCTALQPSGYAGCILADSMGLGKTLQAITLIWTLMKQGPNLQGAPLVRRAVVVAPTSLLNNWNKEIRHWLTQSRLEPYILSSKSTGKQAKTAASEVIRDWGQAPPKRSLLITSYEQFRQHAKAINSVGYELIICDEGHRLKNPAAQISRALMSAPTRRRVILSGTPIQNDLEEFFTMVDFVNPGILSSQASFRAVFQTPILRSREPTSSHEERVLGAARSKELASTTAEFILRRTADILEKYLPPKIEQVVFCAPSELQTKLYERILNAKEIASCLSDSAYALGTIIKLRKIANHPVLISGVEVTKDGFKESEPQSGLVSSTRQDVEEYDGIISDDELIMETQGDEYGDDDDDDEGDSSSITASSNGSKSSSRFDEVKGCFSSEFWSDPLSSSYSGKMCALESMLARIRQSATDDRVVIVSLYSKTLDVIQAMCASHQYPCLRLDGSTPASHRQPLVDRFNDPFSGAFIFLLTSKAGGMGLNLIGGNRLVLFDADWNPATDQQAMARIWRDGQQKVSWVYRLLTTGTIDEKIYQRQISKQALAQSIVDDQSATRRFSKEDLKDIFSLNLRSISDTHELMGCRCHDPNGKISADIAKRRKALGAELTEALDSLSSMRHILDDKDPHCDPLLQHVMNLNDDLITLIFQHQTKNIE